MVTCTSCGEDYEPTDYASVWPWDGACRCSSTDRYRDEHNVSRAAGRTPGEREWCGENYFKVRKEVRAGGMAAG